MTLQGVHLGRSQATAESAEAWNVKTDLFKSSKNFRVSVRKLNKLPTILCLSNCAVPWSQHVKMWINQQRNLWLDEMFRDSKMMLISKPSRVMRILEKMSIFFCNCHVPSKNSTVGMYLLLNEIPIFLRFTNFVVFNQNNLIN